MDFIVFILWQKYEPVLLKREKVACIIEEPGASDWIPSCLLSPPPLNSLVFLLPYEQNCALKCNCCLTFPCCLCCQNISAEYIWCLEELVITTFRNIFIFQSIIFMYSPYINLLMKTMKLKIAASKVIWG